MTKVTKLLTICCSMLSIPVDIDNIGPMELVKFKFKSTMVAKKVLTVFSMCGITSN